MVEGLKETHEAIKQTIESARKTGHDILGGVGSALGTTKETLDSLHNGALELQKDARETVQTLEEAGNAIERGFKTASSVASTLKGVGEWMTSAPKVLDDFQQASKGLGEAAPLVAENTPPVLKPERPAP
ncbi:MAG TPA: hypothetical protein PKX87_08945 [Alphaproteobacteria bacterium]|nr:hypothetical protein [Alphaproteobacteria bacterium]